MFRILAVALVLVSTVAADSFVIGSQEVPASDPFCH